MSSPNWNRGLLAPPSTPKTSVRNAQNATQTSIMIEPTFEYQRFYNQNRREMDRQRLELHVAESNLEPPQAEPMSRSTTSDSHPSPSTVCSHAGDSTTPLSPDPMTEATKSKPSRGRRRGPLDMETRTKTAFKRKFKLTCAFHRVKRTACNCHDFSKLEEGYRKFSAAEGQKVKESRSQSERSLSDLGTFGTGGAGGTALTTPRYQSFDFPDLPIGHELPPHVHASLLPVLKLDIDSEASVNAIVSAPREEPFFLAPTALVATPVATPVAIPMQDAIYRPIAIGCSTVFHNRWQCEYKFSTEETGSRASTDSCSWTGPFWQLEAHFSTAHHPFEPAEVPQWSMCEGCSAMSPGWVEERACLERSNCHPDCWKKWFYGAVPRQSNPKPPILTVSEASGSRSSWLDPSWNMNTSGSSNTEQSNIPFSSSTSKSGFYEHSAKGNEKNEAGSDGGKKDAYRECGRTQNRCRYQYDTTNITRRCCAGGWPPLPRRKMEAKIACYGPQLCIPLPSRLYRHLIPSVLASPTVFHLRGEQLLIKLMSTLLSFLASIHCLRWYLALIILGPLGAWIAMGSLGSRTSGEDGLHVLMPVA